MTSSQTEHVIRHFLDENYSGVLATADAAGNPHAAAIYYYPQQDFTILFATKSETQKYRNIQENKQVAFVVYDEKSQTTIQVFGRVEIVDDPEVRREAIDNMVVLSIKISKRILPPVEKLIAGDDIVLRLVPRVIKMAVYARPDSEGDDLYETLLFSESA